MTVPLISTKKPNKRRRNKMNKRFMALIVVLTLAVSGIANAAVLTGVLSSAENKATAYKQGEQEYWTGFTAQERLPKHGAYWVIVERNGGKWSRVNKAHHWAGQG
jgi:hypothetical protein